LSVRTSTQYGSDSVAPELPSTSGNRGLCRLPPPRQSGSGAFECRGRCASRGELAAAGSRGILKVGARPFPPHPRRQGVVRPRSNVGFRPRFVRMPPAFHRCDARSRSVGQMPTRAVFGATERLRLVERGRQARGRIPTPAGRCSLSPVSSDRHPRGEIPSVRRLARGTTNRGGRRA
jgi:hypothetical protein